MNTYVVYLKPDWSTRQVLADSIDWPIQSEPYYKFRRDRRVVFFAPSDTLYFVELLEPSSQDDKNE